MGLSTRPSPPDDTFHELRGEVEMEVVAESSSHRFSVGETSYFCTACDTRHPMIFIREVDFATDQDNMVAIRQDDEAWEVTRRLVSAFGGITADEWSSAMDFIEQRRKLKSLPLRHHA